VPGNELFREQELESAVRGERHFYAGWKGRKWRDIIKVVMGRVKQYI
jgi:hypothetical protein